VIEDPKVGEIVWTTEENQTQAFQHEDEPDREEGPSLRAPVRVKITRAGWDNRYLDADELASTAGFTDNEADDDEADEDSEQIYGPVEHFFRSKADAWKAYALYLMRKGRRQQAELLVTTQAVAEARLTWRRLKGLSSYPLPGEEPSALKAPEAPAGAAAPASHPL
jgi:hypothetical protein